MRKGSKRLLRTGILAGIAYAAWRWWKLQAPASSSDISWESAPFPFPPVPRPSVPVAPVASVRDAPKVEPFTEPGADGSCPTTHPVKAKLASGIYHSPGGGNYERTKPDRCYLDADAAEADGLRAAKR
jgi:hypothetical protein